jgi:hypothetical protein
VHIQFTQDIRNSAGQILYSAGEKTHVKTSIGENFIFLKEAVAVPRAKRGSLEWLSEMRELEDARQASLPSVLKEHVPSTPVWAVIRLDSGKIAIQRTLGKERLVYGEVTVFKGDIPNLAATEHRLLANLAAAGCPQNVIDRYLAAKKAPNALVVEQAQHEKAVADQEKQRERERQAVKF